MLIDWAEAVAIGAVQGLTEFLPISSDGHLAIVQQAFRRLPGGSAPEIEGQALFQTVMVHLGTVGAVLAYYRREVVRGAAALAGRPAMGGPSSRDVVRAGLLATVATLPLVPIGLFLKPQVDAATESTAVTAAGFLVTAGVLLLTTRLRGGDRGFAEMRWYDAMAIGAVQAVAILPGVSRSGLTVATALALGLSRPWAVGFSLLIMVPAVLGAEVLVLRKVEPSALSGDLVARMALAIAVAGAVGYGAIAWLVRVVRSGRLWYFSVYLVALAAVLLTMVAFAATTTRPVEASGGRTDAEPRRASAVDRPVRGRPEGEGADGVAGRRGAGSLAGADADGPRPGPGAPGPDATRGPGHRPDLVLGGPRG